MNAKEGAARILGRIEAVYVPTHRYVTVNARDFGHLDLAYYDKVQRYLESQGFRWIGDKENLTLSEAPGGIFHRVLIRVLVSADGKICAALYHPKIKSGWLRIRRFIRGKRLGRVVDFASEFSDGSFSITSNAAVAGKMSLPKQIRSEFLVRDTPAETVLIRHRAKLAVQTQAPDVHHRLVQSYDESIAMQNRMNALKSAHRGEIGGITREELDAISPEHPEVVERVHQEIEILRATR